MGSVLEIQLNEHCYQFCPKRPFFHEYPWTFRASPPSPGSLLSLLVALYDSMYIADHLFACQLELPLIGISYVS